ncbi:MAG TPA: tetratricopeptide repeat protein, partial [Bryobacteraceae bacterium]|nr:tetratricopeptide repeat protein [Bryobacteraceae bacterium]
METTLAHQSQDPRLWALDGLVLARLGQSQKALSSYKHALEIAPAYLPALEGAAEIAYKTSNPEAETYLREILQVHPDDQTAHGMLAALSFEHGKCQNAVNEFAQAHDAIASNPPALKQYGYCLLQLKRAADAIPVFQRIRQLNPSDVKATYRLAVVQSIAGQPHSVVKTLQPEIEKNPSDAAALALLADAYESLSDTPRAVAALRQAIVLRPDVSDYYLDFANICLVHDSFQVGVDMLNAGLRSTPNSAPLYMARGILFIQQGKYPDAQADFAKAERLDPEVRFGSPVQGLLELQQNNLA